ncbi:MAG: hypothetical protein N3E36_03410 [Sulfolobales archaeon]|nr:hypothetical protein [Sulfolobales archaeon]MCX8199060.1 hypothetical protein [Sulfolobales archaeon]MDW8170039.1 hypothetical protein [Desulfurococcaceae archaeon]
MPHWMLKCTECKTVWELNVAYNLREYRRLYHYCPRCGRNTFHDILEYVD